MMSKCSFLYLPPRVEPLREVVPVLPLVVVPPPAERPREEPEEVAGAVRPSLVTVPRLWLGFAAGGLPWLEPWLLL